MFSFLQIVLLRLALTVMVALRALRRNKLRSALTLLGIIIGVAAVISMIAVGNAIKSYIDSQISAMGRNVLVVCAGNLRSAGVNSARGTSNTLTVDDAKAILREVPDVSLVSPASFTAVQAISNGRNWSTRVYGASADYLVIRNWNMASGAMFDQRDVRAAAKVAIIGSSTALQLFGPENPVGHIVRMNSIPFVIVGLLASKGANSGGNDEDDVLIVPFTTAMKRLTGQHYLGVIYLQVADWERMEVAQAEVSNLLRQRHRLPQGRDDDFTIYSQKEIAKASASISMAFQLLLGFVAGVSLLVGGIGIMNIMLMSVTERTREIGIRIAVGAQAHDILLQFLIEAISLSVAGGAIGIAIGCGLAPLITMGEMKLHTVVTGSSVLLAFGVSVSVGIFFGFYPARRAAAMDPIEALRYE